MRELNWDFRGSWMFAHEDLGHVDLSNPDEAVVKLTEHKVERKLAPSAICPLEKAEPP